MGSSSGLITVVDTESGASSILAGPPEFPSLQCLECSPDGTRLVVACATEGEGEERRGTVVALDPRGDAEQKVRVLPAQPPRPRIFAGAVLVYSLRGLVQKEITVLGFCRGGGEGALGGFSSCCCGVGTGGGVGGPARHRGRAVIVIVCACVCGSVCDSVCVIVCVCVVVCRPRVLWICGAWSCV